MLILNIKTSDSFEGGEFLETSSYMRGKHKKTAIFGKNKEGVSSRNKGIAWAGISQQRKREKVFVVDHS